MEYPVQGIRQVDSQETTMTLQLPADSRILNTDFVFGVATSSFQIEGGQDSRLPCIWDTFCATPGAIRDGSHGAVACDHIRLWPQDVQLIKSLGVDAYRLSIAWPRVMQQNGDLDPAGVAFYRDLLTALKAEGIRTFVTLYHWDLPQYLEDQGGWRNRDTAYAFADYADKVSAALADLVDAWATLNEPFCSSYLGYEIGVHAPGLKNKGWGRQSAHHLLLAHGLAMPKLRKNAPQAQHGIVLNFTPCYAETDTQADKAAADFADQYFNQWYIKPLFDRAYPECINTLTADQQPQILPGDFDIIAAPLDYLGINFYTRHVYRADEAEGFVVVDQAAAPKTDIGWEIYPQAFTDLLLDLNRRYPLPPLYIMENGAAGADTLVDGVVQDDMRLGYYQQHLLALDSAIRQGVDVRGYFAWSLMDNFEWAEGYLKRFGIVYVDYATQQRVIKQSGLAFRDLSLSRNG